MQFSSFLKYLGSSYGVSKQHKVTAINRGWAAQWKDFLENHEKQKI